MSRNTVRTLLVLISSLFLFASCAPSGGTNTSGINNNLNPGGGIGGGGCASITGPIPFTAQNILFDTNNVVGGQLPGPPYDYWPVPQEGQVVLGGGSGAQAGSFYGYSPIDGEIQMNMTPVTGGSGQMYTNRANATGTISINPYMQQIIYSAMGYQYYQNPGYGGQFPGGFPGNNYPNTGYQGYIPQQQQMCVSGIAFNMGYSGWNLYGTIYLYFNGSQNGVTLVVGQ